jgi:polyisoprenoid-binding protein YceI
MQRIILVLVAALLPAFAAAAPWRLDPATEVTVDVAWQGRVVPVRFPELSGEIDFDAAHPERARATISVATGAATTGAAMVDRLVKSPDYLDVAGFPTITFRLDRLTPVSRTAAEVVGRITLRGVTRPIGFRAEVFRYGPAADDPGRFEAGFDLAGRIDRTEFGSTGGLPEVAAVLPVRIRLMMSSK